MLRKLLKISFCIFWLWGFSCTIHEIRRVRFERNMGPQKIVRKNDSIKRVRRLENQKVLTFIFFGIKLQFLTKKYNLLPTSFKAWTEFKCSKVELFRHAPVYAMSRSRRQDKRFSHERRKRNKARILDRARTSKISVFIFLLFSSFF